MRRAIAEGLEAGTLRLPGGAALARAWAGMAGRTVARPLALPHGARVVAVGGATLGGSGKTPLAVAVARALAERGERVAFVGHAHGAAPRRAREVSADDDVREVGDEALVAARLLAAAHVRVYVAPERSQAVARAAAHARALVVDGLLQASPERVAVSLLALDAREPWGAGRCPPLGDLRAPRDALLSACDAVVLIGDALRPLDAAGRPVLRALSVISGASRADGTRLSLGDLRVSRLGLFAGEARPWRIEAALAALGIRPACTHRIADHALPTFVDRARAQASARTARIDAWIATAKCATRLPTTMGAVPVLALDHRIVLDEAAVEALARQLGSPPAKPVVDCAPCDPHAGTSPSS